MESKKKILFMITKGNFGGAQRYVYDLATNLPSDRFDVVVACGEAGVLKQKLTEKNIKVIEIKSSQRNINILKDIKTFFEIKKIIEEEKPSFIHLNSSKVGGLGALAGRITKTPKIIFTGHGWAFNENRDLFSKIIILFLHWVTIALSHTTIVVSRKVKNDVGGLSFIKDKIKVIYNGILEFDLLPKEEARKTFLESKEPDKTIIFSLAELHKNKGVDVAIQAIALLPAEAREKVIYCVAGGGEEKESLENIIVSLKLDKNVKLLGFVPDAKKLLSGADIFLLPSRTEAFPYAVLEAGISGIPTIATSVGGIPEVIRDMQNGILIHPRNPKEIAEAILYMLDHPEKQIEFGSEVKKTITNFFSLDKMVRETISVYSDS